MCPAEGAVQLYQTEAPLCPETMSGSPGSVVASTLEPFTDPLAPLIACALAKLSLTGAAANDAVVTTSATTSTATSAVGRPALPNPILSFNHSTEGAAIPRSREELERSSRIGGLPILSIMV